MKRCVVGDFDPPDWRDDLRQDELAGVVLAAVTAKLELGHVTLHGAASDPLVLVTTGFRTSTDPVPFAALYWMHQLYYPNQDAKVMRVRYSPVTQPCGPNQLPPFPGNARRYEFSFHEREAIWAVSWLALKCVKLGLNAGIPRSQSDYLSNLLMCRDGTLEPEVFSEGKFHLCAWTELASVENARSNGGEG